MQEIYDYYMKYYAGNCYCALLRSDGGRTQGIISHYSHCHVKLATNRYIDNLSHWTPKTLDHFGKEQHFYQIDNFLCCNLPKIRLLINTE